MLSLLGAIGCGPPKQEALVEAAKTCDMKTLKKADEHFRKNPAALEAPLHAAIGASQFNCVEWLMGFGPKIAFTMAMGAERLRVDVSKGVQHKPLVTDHKMAAMLMDKGAKGTVYLLPVAIRTKHVLMAKVVLNHDKLKTIKARRPPKPLSNQPSKTYQAILYNASTHAGESIVVSQDDVPMMDLLIEQGADPAPHMLSAIKRGKLKMFQVIVDKVNTRKNNRLAITMVLHEKHFAKRAQFLKWLIDKGINHAGALTIVATTDDVASAKLLLKHGAKDIDTAIVNAKKHKQKQMLTVLEAAKASTQTKTPSPK